MPPRVQRTNAGRAVAFLRRPSPPLRTTADPAVEAGGAGCEAGHEPEAGPARVGLDDLRRQVARLEGRMAAETRLEVPSGPAADNPERTPGGECGRAGMPGRLPLGVPGFDGLFARGGLPLTGLIELRTDETRAAGSTTGFLAALLVRLAAVRRGPVLWVREERALQEAGRAAALGFLHLGLDPARLLIVTVRQPADALWAIEEGLGCPGLSAVVGELQGLPKVLDLTASRRLALRARAGGVPAFLAGHGTPPAASAAAARMRLEPGLSRPAGGFDGGPGFPAWIVTVEKNRDGRTGRACLEWNSDERRFRQFAPMPVDLAAPAGDGPARPPAPGQVLAYPGAFGRAAG